MTEENKKASENDASNLEQSEQIANPSENNPEISALEQEVAQYKEAFLRERAENDNLRKRQQRELESAYKFATEKLLRDLLTVLDSLNLSIENAPKSEDNQMLNEFVKGNEMTLKIFNEILEKNGITEINPVGEKLNPEFHQALSMLQNPDLEPNTIIHVAQKGYLLNGRVVRAAQVIVSTK